MPKIPAIETIYKGYKFRSRLEARWAVLMDEFYAYYKSRGLDEILWEFKWQYESEGYDLPSGRYLPDFWIAGVVFHEVKPENMWIDAQRYCSQESFSIGNLPRELQLAKELTIVTGKTIIVSYGDPLFVYENGSIITIDDGKFRSVGTDLALSYFSHDCFQEIAEIARQARFEHGQSGAR